MAVFDIRFENMTLTYEPTYCIKLYPAPKSDLQGRLSFLIHRTQMATRLASNRTIAVTLQCMTSPLVVIFIKRTISIQRLKVSTWLFSSFEKVAFG